MARFVGDDSQGMGIYPRHDRPAPVPHAPPATAWNVISACLVWLALLTVCGGPWFALLAFVWLR